MSTAFIKKVIPIKLKKHLAATLRAKDLPLPEGSRSFVFLAADYGNIGDLAITAAQVSFLRCYAPGQHVVRIPISATRTLIRSVKRQVGPDDLITIIGGGNMGDMYPDIEELRQLVIRSFPENRIVCFPQTLDWDNSVKSKQALKRIVKTYSQHPDIHVFARETITYAKLNELFSAHSNVTIGLVPDIVMSATADTLGTKDCLEPSGILRCLRNDKEAALSAAQYTILDAALTETGLAISKTDTHAGGSQLSEIHCEKLLADKLSQFRAAKLVVTDRLHGMILCLLSGTPCLVLPNANHKIRQTRLDWLRDHPRLIFVEPEQFDEIPNFIEQLLSESRGTLKESPVDISQYNSMKKALSGI
ncbi:polysaccharide pyruvyl transferase family protein [Psychrobacter frigidicola]|uniref:polysaccharide pyruvyl transferase family protein n=1 Tax=Psychrobacter frigidicola TaxID=45611 RepID=UPI0019181FDE|nr:polysaccharide pyruvyl transferase family protein [Psychrobacter frigidicola]